MEHFGHHIHIMLSDRGPDWLYNTLHEFMFANMYIFGK